MSHHQPARILPDPDRGGFTILHRGGVFWARTAPLARAMAECLAEGNLDR